MVKNYWNKRLINFVKKNNLSGVKRSINNGSDVHYKRDLALYLSCRLGYLKIVQYLIENKANIQSNDNAPLTYASMKGHIDVVKYLVEQGADIHHNNDVAFRWAVGFGRFEVVKYFIQMGCEIKKARIFFMYPGVVKRAVDAINKEAL